MAIKGKVCYNCKYYMYDNSTGTSDCLKADDIPEDLFEKHFVDDQPGCPFHEEIDEPDYHRCYKIKDYQ